MNDPNHKGHRLEAAAESTFAKLVARFGTPILLAIIGWFLVGTVGRMEHAQREQSAVLTEQGKRITEIQRDVAVLSTRMDERVIRQVDANSKQIENHEERLRFLERNPRTP
jgi:TolA-binding protein